MNKKRRTIRISVSFMIFTMMIMFLVLSSAFADDTFIEINNVDDLYNVRNNMSGNYKLMCDIDVSDAVAEEGKYNYQGSGWESFGGTTSTPFTGVFDGNGHSIEGLVLNGIYDGWSALFWQNDGTIKNLHVQGSIVKSSNSWSGEALIAGVNNGTINKCSANASINVNSEYSTGIIAAENSGTISQCLSKGSVYGYVSNTDSKIIGGICGTAKKDSVITECANTATVKIGPCNGNVGGIIGSNAGAIISNCYNAGDITGYYKNGQGNANRFAWSCGVNGSSVNCYNAGVVKLEGYSGSLYTAIGENSTNCYYLNTSGIASGATSLNETQMTMQDSFQGFDFENVWIIDPGADYKYPQLRNCRQDLGREIDMIELKSAPDKITYKTGDEFDPTGCVVTVLYKDNGSEDINVTTDMLSGYDMSTAGIQDVKFSYRGYSLSFKINVNQRPEIIGMELTSQPLKTTFIRGTEFDFTGAVAQIRYKDGTTEDFPINAKDCTGGDINTSGDYVITYSKFGHSVTFNVSVVPVREQGIHIETLPDKTSYIEGEEIDTTGLVVNVDYNTGESAPISNYTIADYDNSAGVQTITVQYNDFETTFEVSFAKKNVLSIEVTKQPDKTEYIYGQVFNPTGMIVTARLDNGKTEEVTDYVVSPMEDRNGMQDLTVSYAGKTTYVTVFVTERTLDSISITAKPYKLTYIEGSEFDPEGMIVTAKYNDNSTEVIDDYTMTKLGKTPGNKTIIISYKGKTTTLAVTVIAKTLVNLTVTAPDKVNYIKGEPFDPTGMVVTALYNDGTSVEVTDYRVGGFGESDEANILEISYGGKAEHIVVSIHSSVAWEVSSKATCTKDGQEVRKCKECGEIIETRSIAATGHDFGDWKVTKESTVDSTGLKERACSICGETETETIDKLPNDSGNDGKADSDEQKPDEAGSDKTPDKDSSEQAPDGKKEDEQKPSDDAAQAKKEAVTAANAVLSDAEAISNSDGKYTNDSFRTLTDAIAVLKAELARKDATADSIKVAVQAVQNAKAALKEAEKKQEDGSQSKPSTIDGSGFNYTVGTTVTVGGSNYVVTGATTVTLKTAKNAKKVTVPATIKLLDGKTYKVTQVNAKAFAGKKIKTVTIGKNVKKLAKNAFKSSKATKMIVKTKLLKKATVKGSLKGSKIKNVQVKVGAKKLNKKFVKKYKKIFTKKIAGKKVKVK